MKAVFSGLMQLTPGDAGHNPIGDLEDYIVWGDQNIRGMRLRLSWLKLEPTQGKFDFSVIDDAVSLAHDHNKRLSISICGGYYCPPWVEGLGVYFYASANGEGRMPLPWHENYRELWFNFLSEVAAHVPPGSNKRLTDDKAVTEIIPCGFMTQVGMYFGDATDEQQMPHEGYKDVHEAYRDSVPKILTHYQEIFPTTPLEITYVAPFDSKAGREDGQFIKDWFIDTYPGQGGTMVSSVFAVDQPAVPQSASYPHGGQCFKQVYNNKDWRKLYEAGTPVPSEEPPYPEIFIKTCQNAAAQAMAKLECYNGDLENCPDNVLADMSELLISVAPS